MRRVKATLKESATNTAYLARFVALVALHKEETGRRIAQARDSVGLTQQEAADLAGVDKRTIQRYEAGDIGRMDNVQKLADTYELTIEQLLGEAELPLRRAPISERLGRIEEKLDEALDRLEGLEAAEVVDAAERAVDQGSQRNGETEHPEHPRKAGS